MCNSVTDLVLCTNASFEDRLDIHNTHLGPLYFEFSKILIRYLTF